MNALTRYPRILNMQSLIKTDLSWILPCKLVKLKLKPISKFCPGGFYPGVRCPDTVSAFIDKCLTKRKCT